MFFFEFARIFFASDLIGIMIPFHAAYGNYPVHFWWASKTVNNAKCVLIESISKPTKGSPRFVFPARYQQLANHPTVQKFIDDEKLDLKEHPTSGLPIQLKGGDIVTYVDLATDQFQYKGDLLLPHPKNENPSEYKLHQNPAEFIQKFKAKNAKRSLLDRLDSLTELLPAADRQLFEKNALSMNFDEICDFFVEHYSPKHFEHGKQLESEKSTSLFTIISNQLNFFKSYGQLDIAKIVPLLKFKLKPEQWAFLTKWLPDPSVKEAEQQLLRAAKFFDEQQAKDEATEQMMDDSGDFAMMHDRGDTMTDIDENDWAEDLECTNRNTNTATHDAASSNAFESNASAQTGGTDGMDSPGFSTASSSTLQPPDDSASQMVVPSLNYPANFDRLEPIQVPRPTGLMEEFVRNVAFSIGTIPQVNFLGTFALRRHVPDGQTLQAALDPSVQPLASGSEYMNVVSTGQLPNQVNEETSEETAAKAAEPPSSRPATQSTGAKKANAENSKQSNVRPKKVQPTKSVQPAKSTQRPTAKKSTSSANSSANPIVGEDNPRASTPNSSARSRTTSDMSIASQSTISDRMRSTRSKK